MLAENNEGRCSPVPVHAGNGIGGVLGVLKIDKAEAAGLPSSIAHDHGAADGAETTEGIRQRVLRHLAAKVAHVHVAKFSRLQSAVLQPSLATSATVQPQSFPRCDLNSEFI